MNLSCYAKGVPITKNAMIQKCVFTTRLITMTQSFSPIGQESKYKSVGILWHEAIAGRKDEYVSSAFFKLLMLPQFRDIRHTGYAAG